MKEKKKIPGRKQSIENEKKYERRRKRKKRRVKERNE